jgi:hypothetical protein
MAASAVIAGEAADGAQGLRGGEDIGRDDLIQQAGEFRIREADAVEGLELFTEIGFQRGAVGDVRALLVFEFLEGADKAVSDVVLPHDGAGRGWQLVIANFWRGYCEGLDKEARLVSNGLPAGLEGGWRAGHGLARYFSSPLRLWRGGRKEIREKSQNSCGSGAQAGSEWSRH